MVNIVALLLSATNEETPYEQLLTKEGVPNPGNHRCCARFLLSKEWLKVMQPTPKRPAARSSQGKPPRCLEK